MDEQQQAADFDIASFMSQSQDLGELDTKVDPIPEGEWAAQIGVGEKDIDFKTGIGKDKRTWLMQITTFEITDPRVKPMMKREATDPNPKARMDFFLDLNEAGRLDNRPQKNVKLGKLRAAVGQNRAGDWNHSMLKGQPCKVKIAHQKDKDDPTIVYSRVVAVTAP